MRKSLRDNKDERDGYSNDVVARKGRQMLVFSLLFNVGVGNGAGRREDRSGKMNRRDSRYGFETRSLTARSVAAATFTFYVADPLSSIHEFTLMIKQVASWCLTVGPVPVCDVKRATCKFG